MARPYHRALLPQALDDLRALAKVDDALVDAALQAITDLAVHRQVGKELRARPMTGDLGGCRRLRFDLPGRRPQRYRVGRIVAGVTRRASAIAGERLGRRG